MSTEYPYREGQWKIFQEKQSWKWRFSDGKFLEKSTHFLIISYFGNLLTCTFRAIYMIFKPLFKVAQSFPALLSLVSGSRNSRCVRIQSEKQTTLTFPELLMGWMENAKVWIYTGFFSIHPNLVNSVPLLKIVLSLSYSAIFDGKVI